MGAPNSGRISLYLDPPPIWRLGNDASAGQFGHALAEIPNRRPDVVLMDIQLPGLSGLECVRRLKARLPIVQFIMLTVLEDDERVFDPLAAGATG